MRRRLHVPGPTFGWAGDSRWRHVLAWLLRSAIVVIAAIAAYLVLVYLLLPLVLSLARGS
jgi:hypothetical protein